MAGEVGALFRNPWKAPFEADVIPESDRLVRALEAHEAAEEDSVSQYADLARNHPDGVVRLLLRLVADDERRHRELLAEMVASIRDDLEGRRSPNALGAERGGESSQEAAAEAIRALMAEEHEGAAQLRQLARHEHILHDELYALLLDIMARDSEKHERVLRYVLKRIEGTG